MASRVKPGVYGITQRQQEGEETWATLDKGISYPWAMRDEDSGSPLFMSSHYTSAIHSWTIQPLLGVESLYEIRPATSRMRIEGSGDWGIYASDESVDYHISSYFTIWKIEYEEFTMNKDENGTPRKTYSRCRIIEAGPNRCWTVDDQGKNILAQVADRSLSRRQMFEISELNQEQPQSRPTVSISTVTPLSVKAVNERVVRKLYFGTNKINANIINNRDYMQMVTDARHLGGADGSECAGSTWFEIAIFSKLPAEGEEVILQQVKHSSEQKPLIWKSHKLPCQKNANHVKLIGRRARRFEGLWKFLEEGDFIGVLACAQHKNSVCDVRGGSLIIGSQ